MSDEALQAIKRIESRIDKLWHLVTMDKDRMWNAGCGVFSRRLGVNNFRF